MGQQVLQNPLLDGDLRAGVSVLHLASPAGTRVQPSMRAFGSDPERRVLDDLGEACFFPIVFFPVDIGHDHLKWQSPINKNDLAVFAVCNPLGIEVHGLNV